MIQIDFIPYICEAFSTNPKIYKLIDDLYKKEKINNYKLAKDSKWYTHPMASEGSLEQEEYFKKTLGILTNSNINMENILKIIRKGWKYAYTYFRNNQKIDLDDFGIRYFKKMGSNNITDDDVNSNALMLIFLSSIVKDEYEKCDIIADENRLNLDAESYKKYIEYLVLRLEHYKGYRRVDYNNISKEEKSIIQKLKLKILNQVGEIKINTLELKDKKIDKYLKIVDCLFDYENISLPSICNEIKISNRDIEEILYLWVMGEYDKEYSDSLEEVSKFIIDMLKIKAFCKAYKQAKEYHFKNNQETMFVELEDVEHNLREVKIQNKIQIDKIKENESEIEKLKRENKRLKEELKEKENNKQEITALRELMFNLDKKEDINNKIDYDINKINTINGVIVGGTQAWQDRIKEKLNNFSFISLENLNFDINIVRNADIVVIYTNYLSHALYYKVIHASKNKEILFINNSNENMLFNKIYEKIKDIVE